jgi:itaconyl-CoA hydratase
MVQNWVQVGENRFRETFGRYYEDFEVGHTYEHRPGRTISEADNTWFTLLTMNKHPLHFDAEYCKHSEFGQLLVNSALTVAIVAGMSVSDISQKAIANLGWTDIKMPAPVFVGDTLYAESTVTGKRESSSRPTQGIVSVSTRAWKQDGRTVMTFARSMLVPKRGHGVDDRILAAERAAAKAAD